jgi:phage terminase large subunit
VTTTTTEHEVRTREGTTRWLDPKFQPQSLGESFFVDLQRLSANQKNKRNEIKWPNTRYQQDPVLFCREILGMPNPDGGDPVALEPWHKQIEILEAVRDHKRVAICSGHKVGKSTTLAILALWFYCSFDRARVVMTSVTSRQVDEILWREVRIIKKNAQKPIDGDMHELARSGLKSEDFREIVGFTAKEAEAVAGVSGANLLYLLDEASGIPAAIFNAIEGNRAAGARLCMASNPTKTEGDFYDAFSSKKHLYKTIQISSEDSPNVIEGREVIPGLAGREWVEEKRIEWGVDHPYYKIRVKGVFVLDDAKRILSVDAIVQAEARWYVTEPTGRLSIGLDPAGEAGDGDETIFAARRGNKVMALYPFRGLNEEGHLVQLLGIIEEFRMPRDQMPLVVYDGLGVGAGIGACFRGFLAKDNNDRKFELLSVRASDNATREPSKYVKTRDELWANAAAWIRDGGAIPEDAKLQKELHQPEWLTHVTGRLRVTPKEEIKKALGRSPDRADAFALCVWTRATTIEETPTRSRDRRAEKPAREIDAYQVDGLGTDEDPHVTGGGVYG